MGDGQPVATSPMNYSAKKRKEIEPSLQYIDITPRQGIAYTETVVFASIQSATKPADGISVVFASETEQKVP